MIKNIKGLMLAGAAVVGAASLIPMATYAATDTTNVTVTVAPTIKIDAATGVTLTDVTSGSVYDTGKIAVTVSANKGYKIQLSAAQPRMYPKNDDGSLNTSSDQFIPAGTPSANTSAWGVKINNQSTYTALNSTPVDAYTAAAGAQSAVTNFPVGISIAPSLAAGTYETTVTVTASTN